jgi:16S rRNA (guanine527-N7)-methyltransferase
VKPRIPPEPGDPTPDAFHVEPSGDTADPLPVGTEPPPEAEVVFAERLPLARRYAAHLATTGVEWGLLGPREVPRLWGRHVLNCAVLSDLLPHGATVVDIGSGAGLPGIALALRRPDLDVTLVEPLLRRVDWLSLVLDDLGLERVHVRRARAEDLHGELEVPYVTARAVASLDRLCRWGLPLLRPGGELLAIKGRSADEEIARTASAVRTAGGIDAEVVQLAAGLLDDPVTVVRVKVGQGRRPRR